MERISPRKDHALLVLDTDSHLLLKIIAILTQLQSGEDIAVITRGDDTHLAGDGLGGDLVVTCNHDHIDASPLALGDGSRHFFSGLVHNAHQTQEYSSPF